MMKNMSYQKTQIPNPKAIKKKFHMISIFVVPGVTDSSISGIS